RSPRRALADRVPPKALAVEHGAQFLSSTFFARLAGACRSGLSKKVEKIIYWILDQVRDDNSL
ncbi:MAG: hypothetical protein WCZ08_01855, partial [Parcubacteria group bacterium]